MDAIQEVAIEYPRHIELHNNIPNSLFVYEKYESIELSENAITFSKLLLESKRKDAMNFVHELIEEGTSIEAVYKDFFQQTLQYIGEKWQEREISVAQEHYSSVVIQFIMSTLYDKIFHPSISGKRLLSFSVSHELHEIGVRMISDLFEMRGWDTEYLGSSLPVNEFIDYAKEFKPDLIAISVTMPYHLRDMKEAIEKIREIDELKDSKIIVGGIPFRTDDTLYLKVGADAYAKDLSDAISIGEALVN